MMKHDRTGRSTAEIARSSRHRIEFQFIPHAVEMLKSPAWIALSHPARRVLDRLEIEHAAHGGKENGKLPCTYSDFEDYGIRRQSIGGAIRELVALGLVEVTQHGGRSAQEHRRPSLYRVTYLHKLVEKPTDEWAKHDADAVEAILLGLASEERAATKERIAQKKAIEAHGRQRAA